MLGHGDAQGADVSNAQVVVALCALQDGRLASGGWDQTLRVWPAEAVAGSAGVGAAGGQAGPHQHSVLGANGVMGSACLALCIAHDGAIAAGYGDGTVRLWRETEPGAFAAGASFAVGTVVRGLAGAGTDLAQCGNDGIVRLWRPGGAGAYTLAAASPAVGSYVFCIAAVARRGRHEGAWELAAGSDDGLVRMWRLGAEGALSCVQAFGAGGGVWSIRAVGNGDLLVAADTGGLLLFSRAPSRAAPRSLQLSQAAAQQAYAAANGGQVAAPLGGVTGRGGEGGGASGGGGGAVASPQYDFVFPVEMGGGTTQIRWNRGDDPSRVAAEFAHRNQVPPEEVQDIVNFINTAGGSAPPPTQGPPAVPAAPVAPPAGVQAGRVAQLAAMGFDAERCRAALERAGWDVEAALAVLLG